MTDDLAVTSIYLGWQLATVEAARLRDAPGSTPAEWQRDLNVFISGVLNDRATAPPAPVVPPAPTLLEPVPPVEGNWQLVYDDEFADLDGWNIFHGERYGANHGCEHIYMLDNVERTADGLRIEAHDGTGFTGVAGPTSGLITTRKAGGPLRFKYRHGYCEARMRCTGGPAVWPAFWLVGPSDGTAPGWPDYGEIDIMEAYGSRPDRVESNFHRPGGNIGARAHELARGPLSEWHTYGLDWTADRLDWWIDGVLVRSHRAVTSDELAALSYEHSFIINLAIGGDGPKYHGYVAPADGDDLPASLEVEYVRVWQRAPT